MGQNRGKESGEKLEHPRRLIVQAVEKVVTCSRELLSRLKLTY